MLNSVWQKNPQRIKIEGNKYSPLSKKKNSDQPHKKCIGRWHHFDSVRQFHTSEENILAKKYFNQEVKQNISILAKAIC